MGSSLRGSRLAWQRDWECFLLFAVGRQRRFHTPNSIPGSCPLIWSLAFVFPETRYNEGNKSNETNRVCVAGLRAAKICLPVQRAEAEAATEAWQQPVSSNKQTGCQLLRSPEPVRRGRNLIKRAPLTGIATFRPSRPSHCVALAAAAAAIQINQIKKWRPRGRLFREVTMPDLSASRSQSRANLLD